MLTSTDGNGNTTTYNYYANGNRLSMVYPNGVTTEYTYYPNNLLHTMANKRSGTIRVPTPLPTMATAT